MSGSVIIAGLGPGDDRLLTHEVQEALAEATDVIGYIPYLGRVAPRPGLTLHASDNRVELERANHALDLAEAGRRVVVVAGRLPAEPLGACRRQLGGTRQAAPFAPAFSRMS